MSRECEELTRRGNEMQEQRAAVDAARKALSMEREQVASRSAAASAAELALSEVPREPKPEPKPEPEPEPEPELEA